MVRGCTFRSVFKGTKDNHIFLFLFLKGTQMDNHRNLGVPLKNDAPIWPKQQNHQRTGCFKGCDRDIGSAFCRIRQGTLVRLRVIQ